MRNSKHALKRLAIALGALLLVSAVGLAQVTVSVPTLTLKAGTTQAIPLTVTDLTGKGVISYGFTVTYDPTILTVTAVTPGPILSGWPDAPTYRVTSGQVKVGGYGQTVLAGQGTLVYVVVSLNGARGNSPLTLTDFVFNDNTVPTKVNGSIGVPQLSVKIDDVSTGLPVGSSFLIPIRTESVTGMNVIGVGFTVTYDATKVLLTGVDTTGGAMTKGWTNVVNAATAGTLTYGGSNSTALTGAGVLINLVGKVVAIGGSSVLHFTQVLYNDNNPVAGPVDGSVTLGTPQKPVKLSISPATLTTAGKNVAIPFVVHAYDPGGGALTFTWKVNDGLVRPASGDSTYTATFTDAHGTAKKVSCVFTTVASLSDSVVWNFTITDVRVDAPIPSDFVLGQNYPNPFNPTTQISYSLPKEAPVTFEVYNMLGVKVRTLLSGEMRSAGTYRVTWDGRNDAGVGMPSGVYLYRVLAGSYLSSKKMTLLK